MADGSGLNSPRFSEFNDSGYRENVAEKYAQTTLPKANGVAVRSSRPYYVKGNFNVFTFLIERSLLRVSDFIEWFQGAFTRNRQNKAQSVSVIFLIPISLEKKLYV